MTEKKSSTEVLKDSINNSEQKKVSNNIFYWFGVVFSKYAQFDGRASRREFWSFYLASMVISFGLGITEGVLLSGLETEGSVLGSLFTIIIFLPTVAVWFRRLHDTNKSGWYILLGFIPIAGPFIMLIFSLSPSDEGENRYGPNPYAAIS